MKNFAISNLAFGDLTFDSALRFLQANRIEGLELAPTLIWKDPELATREERKDLKNLVSDHGLSIVALQSLLYSKPHLNLFKDQQTDKTLLDFLKEMVTLCSDLGGRSLSFGSPKNRIKGDLELDEAISRITPFFYNLAEYARTTDSNVIDSPGQRSFVAKYYAP